MSRCVVLLLSLALLAVPASASAQRLSRHETKRMQRALHVRADGVIGHRTRRALRRFERRHGFPVDGRPDQAVLEALGVREPAPDPGSTSVSAAVDAAESAIGSPYAYGGSGPDGFDCSGLTVWAFDHAGIDLPRTSYDQYEEGQPVADDAIEAGDLVFFDTGGDGASHVGIATGPDTAISATTSSGVVEHSFTDGYWGDHFLGARRIGEA